MELRTERVPARRVLRGDDGAPLDHDRVLALAIRWADRPLTVEHVKPGSDRAPIDGVEIRWEEGMPVVALSGGTRAWVERSAGQWAEAGRRAALEAGEVLVVHSGELTLEARLQRRSEKAGKSRQESFFFGLVMAHSLMLFAAVTIAMVITPRTDEPSMWGTPGSILRLAATPWLPEPVKKAPVLEERVNDVVTKAAHKQVPPLTQKKSTAMDVLKLLMGGGGGMGAFSKTLGGGLNDAIANLGGHQVAGPADGLSGMNGRDLGGGIGNGGLGLNGPIGPGRGPGSPGLPTGLGGHRSGSILCAKCAPELSPGYDRDLVLKVVKRHQNEIRFCYESELSKNPGLAGKVTVAWTIGASGAVESAQIAESGLSNADVEACIVQRVRRWNFPEPSGGQEVAITFPWVFQTAGSDE